MLSTAAAIIAFAPVAIVLGYRAAQERRLRRQREANRRELEALSARWSKAIRDARKVHP